MKFTVTHLEQEHIELNDIIMIRGREPVVGLREIKTAIPIKGSWLWVLNQVYGGRYMRIHDMQLGLHLANYIIEKGVK